MNASVHVPDETGDRVPGPPDRLELLAPAIVRIAASDSLEELAAAASRDGALLADASGAAVLIWNDAERPVAAGIDGDRWGFPDILARAIEASTRSGEPDADVLRLAGFRDATSRRVVATVRLAAPSGDRGVLVLLDDAAELHTRPDGTTSSVLRAFGAAVGSFAEQISTRQLDAIARQDPAHGLLIRDARAERRRIARELHDGLIQSLYGTGLAIRARSTLAQIPPRGRATMLEWVDRIDRLIVEARDYVDELERADDAVAELGAGLDAIAESAAVAGLDVSTDVSATEQVRPSSHVRREILLVAREAVSNAIRHSAAGRLTIRVEMDPGLDRARLTVEDDGVGFDPGVGLPMGHGLRNMAARAASLGGELDVASQPGGGTKIRFQVRLGSHAPHGGDGG